jgi:hypothetical protein
MNKPFSIACERNRDPILAVLRTRLADRHKVLEIGSGTGQHAVFFAAALPHLLWQASDVADNLPGIRSWLDEAGLANTPAPREIDINRPVPEALRDTLFDAFFTANTLHIMSWPEVERLFAALAPLMDRNALLVAYGPFKYGGHFTSPSNASFDAALRAARPERGIRDFEAVNELARAAGLSLLEDREMPANNRCIVWQRTER